MATVSVAFTIDSDSATFGVGTATLSAQSTSTPLPTGLAVDTSVPPPRKPTSSTPTNTAAAASATPTSLQNNSSPSTGQTIGITIGVVVGACLLMCIIFFFCWRRKSKRSNKKASSSTKGNPRSTKSASKHSKQLSPNAGPQFLSTRATTNYHTVWPRPIQPEEIGVAVTSPERQSFIKRLTMSKPKPRSILPISAPIPLNEDSLYQSFPSRYFAAPPPEPMNVRHPSKHVSDATTIRTSCNPPTPSEPPIAVLPSHSTRTSAATTFEEDKEYLIDEVPPMPTFTAVELPLKPLKPANPRRDQSKPSRLNLESGIKKSINRAMCSIPMTPRYDNGNVVLPTRPGMAIIPKYRIRSPKEKTPSKSRFPKEVHASTAPKNGNPPTRNNIPAYQSSPPSPYAIPDRDSSLSRSKLHANEEWIVQDDKGKSSSSERLRAQQTSVSKSKKTSRTVLGSPIQNLKYPSIPTSASETYIRGEASALKSQGHTSLKGESVSYGDMNKTTKTTRTPRTPKTSNPSLTRNLTQQDTGEGSSNNSHIIRQFQPPSRIDIPRSAQNRKNEFSQSELMPPRALLTPNRTTSGDLILTVNM